VVGIRLYMGKVELDGLPPCFYPMLDERGFVYIGGVKVARYVRERDTLQFVDKDKRRATRRGCPVVEVRVERLWEILSLLANGSDLL